MLMDYIMGFPGLLADGFIRNFLHYYY